MVSLNRFSHIDALRGIAALLVVWLHVSEVFIHISPETSSKGTFFYDVAKYVDFGRIGVVIFFSISGFVICKSLRGNVLEGSRKFLIRRVLRLYPAFWVSIALGAISIWWLFDKPIDINIILANITMLPELFGEQPVIGLYWTLETELIFYLLCWFLFINRCLDNPLVLFFVATFFSFLFLISRLIFAKHGLRPSLAIMPYNLSLMFWGGLFRYWYEDKKSYIDIGEIKIKTQTMLYLLTGIILTPALVYLTKGYVKNSDLSVTFGISYILGVSIFVIGNSVFKIKNNFMVWTGTVSYSLYLFHPVVFYSLLWFLKNNSQYWLKTFHLSVYILITVVFSLLLSAIIYHFIEKPSIDYAHKLTR